MFFLDKSPYVDVTYGSNFANSFLTPQRVFTFFAWLLLLLESTQLTEGSCRTVGFARIDPRVNS